MDGRAKTSRRSFAELCAWVLVSVFCVPAAMPAPTGPGAPAGADLEAARLNNLGVAYMNQQMLDKALSYFSQAIAAKPALAVPHLNRGIALLTGQRLNEARTELEQAAKDDPRNARVWYNLGLLERTQNHEDAMLRDFRKVVENEPGNADAHYFLGTALSSRNEYAAAIKEYKTALQLVPVHASAEFGLARALQHIGDADGARVHLEHFQQVTREKLSAPLAQTYGDQGIDSLAVAMRSTEAVVAPMIPVMFTVEPLLAGKAPAAKGGEGMCLIDVAGHGDPDLIVVGGDAPLRYLRHQAGGGFAAVAAAEVRLKVEGRGVACAVGDFDNDGHPDVAIAMSDRVLLYRNRGDGTFEDAGAKAGITALNHPAGLTFVDFDHDGDLDLLVTGSSLRAGQPESVLWRNNGNGTFTEWTAQTGLGGAAATANVVLSDLNNDRAVDLVIAGDDGVSLYLNQREGMLKKMPLYAGGTPRAARGVAVVDFNKDGMMDLAVTHDGAPGLTLWRNVDGSRFERIALPLEGVKRAWGVTPIDVDNDGWIDLAVVVETARGMQVRVLRNRGPAGFEDVSRQLHLDDLVLPGVRGVIAADVDGDGAADLIVAGAGASPMLLKNVGGSRNHSAKIVLHGLADNKTSLGVKVEVFAGGNWQKWEVAGSSGYLSQGPTTILAGLGASAHPEIVRLLWPTGVPQDEIDTVATTRIELTELDRRGSSCPVVFAWDGTKYSFVTDTIGAAVIGHWFSPAARNKPDADEWIKVDRTQLRARNGLLSLRMGEPMEEVNYIDQVRLVAIDHPRGTLVYPDERFRDDPPFASGKTIAARAAHPARAIWDDQGKDVTPLLAAADHRFLADFKTLGYDGFAKPHSLTVDLGSWSADAPLRLLLTGYIEYFSASSLYSAWQAGMRPVSPYVEAQGADGRWTRVIDDIGFPAGLERTMVADLTGKLPVGTRRIRITTNLQIYWDRLLIDNEPDGSVPMRETEVPLAAASLAFRGYPKQIDGASPGDLTYDYQQASATGPFERARGLYTRTGDVTSLLTGVDDRYAIFGSGEDLDLEFRQAALPALPKGWTRDYFFYANGYVKDMDFYEALPATVADLPFHGMGSYPYGAAEHFPLTRDSVAYQLEWNDRADGDQVQGQHAFRYVPRSPVPETVPLVSAAGR